MEVTEALRTSILEPRDHLHINQLRTFAHSAAGNFALSHALT